LIGLLVATSSKAKAKEPAPYGFYALLIGLLVATLDDSWFIFYGNTVSMPS